MSPRQSKAGSRSSSRSRSARGGKSAGRGSSQSRSLSASRRSGSNTRSAAGATRRRGQQTSGRTPARSKRGRGTGASAAYAVKLLQQDHRAVAEALEEFESAEHEEKQSIAERICKMLTVHAQIEEELLYPAARDALDADDARLVAEASVEHASVKDLIEQIQQHGEVDEEYEAKMQVMGEYVKHHVKEEETELFPKLERSSLDLDSLGERLEERKKELMGEAASEEGTPMHDEEQESAPPSGRSRGGRAHRSSALHARRR